MSFIIEKMLIMFMKTLNCNKSSHLLLPGKTVQNVQIFRLSGIFMKVNMFCKAGFGVKGKLNYVCSKAEFNQLNVEHI